MQDNIKRAARLLTRSPSTTKRGHCVFLGDPLDHDGPVFIGWAPRSTTGIDDLIALVQIGSPFDVSVLGLCAATPAEVEEDRARLKGWCCRGQWFVRSGPVREYLLKLRGEWNVPLDIEDLPPARPRSLCKPNTKPRVNRARSVSKARRTSKRRASK